MQGFSFFEVATNYEKEILSNLKKFMWNNYKCSVELSKAVGDSSKSRDRDKPRKSFRRGGKRTKPRNSFRRKRR